MYSANLVMRKNPSPTHVTYLSYDKMQLRWVMNKTTLYSIYELKWLILEKYV